MKPKTKRQREIVMLSDRMKPVSDAALREGYGKMNKYAFSHPRGYLCGECGWIWNESSKLLSIIDNSVECPKCGRKLILIPARKRVVKDMAYFGIVTTAGEYQVFRMMLLTKTSRRGQRAEMSEVEAFRLFYDVKGKKEILSRDRVSYYNIDTWIGYSDMQLRGEGVAMTGGYPNHIFDFNPVNVYSRKKILPFYKRNGFDGDFHGRNDDDVMNGLAGNPRFETLWKAGYYNVLCIDKYWDELKICMRNGYKIQDFYLWTDMVDNLRHFGKDTHNAHYVCPADLKDAHDYWHEKRAVEAEREAERERIEKMEADNREYVRKHAKYLGVAVCQGDIRARVLGSVQEFYEEGEEMHNCVFHSRYFERAGSLILSVRDNTDKRIATVEVDDHTGNVLQCRAVCNQKPERYDDIISLIDSNKMKIIKPKRKGATI